jgi:hypothetical protein
MSAALYRLLLRLYPVDIRRRWEAEMAETFALQLADAWQDARWRGAFAVWRCALAEIFQVALPAQAAREGVVIPIVSLAGSGTLFFGLIWALGNSLALLSLYHRLLAKLGG